MMAKKTYELARWDQIKKDSCELRNKYKTQIGRRRLRERRGIRSPRDPGLAAMYKTLSGMNQDNRPATLRRAAPRLGSVLPGGSGCGRLPFMYIRWRVLGPGPGTGEGEPFEH